MFNYKVKIRIVVYRMVPFNLLLTGDVAPVFHIPVNGRGIPPLADKLNVLPAQPDQPNLSFGNDHKTLVME